MALQQLAAAEAASAPPEGANKKIPESLRLALSEEFIGPYMRCAPRSYFTCLLQPSSVQCAKLDDPLLLMWLRMAHRDVNRHKDAQSVLVAALMEFLEPFTTRNNLMVRPAPATPGISDTSGQPGRRRSAANTKLLSARLHEV